MKAFGFLNLNKPQGWTSHDCVAKIRRSLRIKRVGHGGTLDPAATGVLPIAIGRATRLIDYLPTQKAYRARIRLGVQTATDDLEGNIVATQSADSLTLEVVQSQLARLIGKIDQIPPAYSAIQQNGKRLYDLARQGIAVNVPVRQVEIYDISVLGWHSGQFPEVEVEIACGRGTYIRAIARDLGQILGVGGTLAALERTESCGMILRDSLTLEQVKELKEREKLQLTSPQGALAHLPQFILSESDCQRWLRGQAIAIPIAPSKAGETGCALDGSGQLLGVGILARESEPPLLRPKVVLQ
jgi:tRNA pseudouridine55 synthase